MKAKQSLNLIIVSSFITLLTACLPSTETGTVVGGGNGSSSNPPDFTATPDPTTPTVTLPPELPPPVQTAEESFKINGGASFTTESDVQLSIVKYEALQMKISENANCTGGVWEEFQSLKDYRLSRNSENKVATLSIQFTDYDNALSMCFSSSILHDNKGPEIIFQKYPLASIEEGVATEIIYDISDRASGVASAECRLNDILRPCPIGLSTVAIPGLPAGDYTFQITATDNVGFVSHNSISWEVTSTTKLITHSIHVDEYRKWDILFVIDNSGSMSYEQKNMAERTRNFLSVLRGLDWQIAVTTTDARDIKLGDGRFIELTDRKGEYILNSSMNEESAQRSLGLTLQRPETGSS
ncbi:MAG: hypothetical protein KDD38_11040, partial [Bdellovibrionales bacterium]|nr:hypothetical protein [Bdellovibrionales bacterium]